MTEGSEDRNSEQLSNLKAGADAEIMEQWCYYLFAYGLLRLLSYAAQDHTAYGWPHL